MTSLANADTQAERGSESPNRPARLSLAPKSALPTRPGGSAALSTSRIRAVISSIRRISGLCPSLLDRDLGGHRDDRRAGMYAADRLERVAPATVGQPDVGGHQIEAARFAGG